MLRALVTALLLVSLTGCITVTRAEEEKPPRTPRRYEAAAPGPLTPTELPGVLAAAELGPKTYFDESTEYWCRFVYGEWFMAFTFDGAWFPYPDNELPPYLAGFQTPDSAKTVKQRLKDLERQLEELERAGNESDSPEPSPPR